MYPSPVDPTALFYMGAQGMGARRPFNRVRNIFGANEEEEQPYEEQQRAGLPGEFEGYIDPSSVAMMLKGMRKDAISQGLIGAGSALLGAPDLASGLSQGAAAFSTPFFEYKNQARELPIQMAQARYGFAGEEERRQRERQQAGQTNALFPHQLSEAKFGTETQHLRKRAMRLQNALDKVGLQGDRTRLGYLADQLETSAQMSKEELNRIREELNFYRQSFQDRLQSIKSGNYATEAGARRDVIDAGGGGRGGGRGSGGLYDDDSLSRRNAIISGATTDMDKFINDGTLPYRNRQIQQGWLSVRLYDDLRNVPDDLAMDILPEIRTIDQVLTDVHSGMSDEELEQRWGGNPAAYQVLSWLFWDRERDMGRGAK